jgi:hypothetical protein
MLTGRRPFSGSTPAKLALQHLHEPPDVSPLPSGDQGPIRRALAKSPDARFPNCRALLDELSLRRARPPRRQQLETAPPRAQDTPSVDTFSHTVVTPLGGLTSMARKRAEEQLPPLDVAAEDARFYPALFIGIGHSATAVLRRLKRRFQERLGDASQYDALKILCLDTDSSDLNEALRAGDLTRLNDEEILPLPLRSPLEYRENAELRFSWISRRWIYNVPRSRQTEGLRPLGRLAFVDHHRAILSRLRTSIDQITGRDAVDRTARLCDMSVGDFRPRVYVVASISGGVGSGMVADLAYTVRNVLDERGLRDCLLYGFLLSGTGKSSLPRDIAVANAYSCLNELYHYVQRGGYPGDASCDLPALDDEPPFDWAYFLDLGRESLPDEYAALMDGLAEYLFLESATVCGHYLNACRKDSQSHDEGMCLRTIGVSQSGSLNYDAVSLSARLICEHLLRGWLRPINDQAPSSNAMATLPDKLRQLERQWDDIATQLRERLATRLESDPLQLIQRELEPFCRPSAGNEPGLEAQSLMREVEDATDRAIGIDRYSSRPALRYCLRAAAEQIADNLADTVALELRQAVFEQFRNSGPRVGQAEAALRQIVARLDALIERATERQHQLSEQLGALVQYLQRGVNSTPDPASAEPAVDTLAQRVKAIRQYGVLRFNDFLGSYVKRVLARTRHQAEALTHQLMGVRRDLTRLTETPDSVLFTNARTLPGGVAARQSVIASLLMDMTRAHLDEFTQQLDSTLTRFFAVEKDFQNSQNDQTPQWQRDMLGHMHRYARSIVSAYVQLTGLEPLLRQYQMSDTHLAEWMHDALKLAVPKLIDSCGGKSRVVVAVPRGSECTELEIILATNESCRAKFLPVSDGDVTFCHEAGSIPIHQFAATLLQTCPRSTEIVGRIHSRTDVKWTPLIQLE